MNLQNQFIGVIKKENLFSPKDKLLLAVSGGVDSVVLCQLCKQAGYDFSITHCNFQLRGDESTRDEQFAKQLGIKYGVNVLVKKFNTEKFATENKMSIQEAARVLRYEWFDELIIGLGAKIKSYVLTAHHADDNAETVLMNFCRGTGLHGLTGIPVSNGNIRRPLLFFTKEELLRFAKENKLDFAEDSSNLSSRYTRNLFRNEIIPIISKAYPQVKENLIDNVNRFKEIERLFKIAVADIKKKLVKEKRGEWYIPINQLMSYNNRALVYEIISDFDFTEKQIEEVVKLVESDSGRYIDSPDNNYRIIKHRHWFIISKSQSDKSDIIIIEEKDKTIAFEAGKLHFEITRNRQTSTSTNIACLDAKKISFPLILRKWKQGDYFYPLGMKKKKKLARFFIDQKLSKTDKEKVWVLESNKKILWIMGMRIDERFKVTEKTAQILQVNFSSAK